MDLKKSACPSHLMCYVYLGRGRDRAGNVPVLLSSKY